MAAPWTVVKAADDAYGRRVELRAATFGKGRTRLTSWRMYCDNQQVGYASTASDAEENYARALAGLRRDSETGRWVPNSPMSVDAEQE